MSQATKVFVLQYRAFVLITNIYVFFLCEFFGNYISNSFCQYSLKVFVDYKILIWSISSASFWILFMHNGNLA